MVVVHAAVLQTFGIVFFIIDCIRIDRYGNLVAVMQIIKLLYPA